jgi:hypothetical protein
VRRGLAAVAATAALLLPASAQAIVDAPVDQPGPAVVSTTLATYPHVPAEPPLRCYVTASCR